MNLFKLVLELAKKTLNKRFESWLKQRVPSRFKHTLTSRNIFILPTKFGLSFLFFDVLLFLLGTNYQNNTILLLSYLLASLFITVMLHSFYNLSQLKLSSSKKQFTFASQQAFFPINVIAKKSHFDLNFHYVKQGSSIQSKIKIDQCKLGENKALVPYLINKRGIYKLGRIKVYSEYSLGLFITWSMLDFSHQLVVYPQPLKFYGNHDYSSGCEETPESNSINQSTAIGIDDFSELKSHIVGESQARVAWKQLARGQGKLSKHYDEQQESLRWLKLSDMPSNDIEKRLSHLCFLILEYSKKNVDYGLILDSPYLTVKNKLTRIMPNSGHQHQQECLVALAQFTHNENG